MPSIAFKSAQSIMKAKPKPSQQSVALSIILGSVLIVGVLSVLFVA